MAEMYDAKNELSQLKGEIKDTGKYVINKGRSSRTPLLKKSLKV